MLEREFPALPEAPAMLAVLVPLLSLAVLNTIAVGRAFRRWQRGRAQIERLWESSKDERTR